MTKTGTAAGEHPFVREAGVRIPRVDFQPRIRHVRDARWKDNWRFALVGRPDYFGHLLRHVLSQLTAEAIVNGVKANAASGVNCLKMAVARGEITNGSHKLVLDWTIRPDGSVSVAQVVGPADMLRTSIPSCYGSAMHAWQLPATPRGAPVRNFPLAFSVR